MTCAPRTKFPVSKDGFATFVNLDGDYDEIEEVLARIPHSLRRKLERSQVFIF